MTTLSPALSRLAAVLLLVIGVPLLVYLMVAPVMSHVQSLREEIDGERLMLGRFGQVANRQAQAAEFDRASQAAVESNAYLKGESESIRAAGLQRLLAELAAADRVRLYSTRALEARERGEVKLIGVRVQFQGEIEQVRALLYRIESARPFLFLEAVQIHPLAAYSPGDEQTGILDVRFDVFGAIPQKRD